MQHDPDELEEMGATYNPAIGMSCRSEADRIKKIVQGLKQGYGPVCVRFLAENMTPSEAGAVLDFGCGIGGTTGAVHVRALRKLGYDCTGYEWEPEDDDESGRAETYDWAIEEELIDPEALDTAWDVVIANNVLNIQPSWDAMRLTLKDMKACMDSDTLLLVNMPSSPRRVIADGADGLDETHELLDASFGCIVELEPGLWACYRPRPMSPKRWKVLVGGL